MKRSVRILWWTFLIGVVTFNLLIILTNYGLLGYMPSMQELENPNSALSSEVFATDGTVIGRYYVQDRSNCKYSDISPNIFNALIATEDTRFYEHSGIDWIGTAAIPVYMVLHKKRGSSTITQQLAKNLFPRKNESSLTIPFIKLKEWIMAVKLEKNLTKNEVITLYLNTVPFGDNVYGIKNASLTFFNKLPSKISVDEAAVLIGMLKGNTIYNPRRNPAKSLERRNVVLRLMKENDFITEKDADNYLKMPIKLDYHKIDYHEGIAPYFRQVVELEVKKVCKELKKSDGSNYDIYKDGLRIYTTLDVRFQQYAEEAVQEHMTQVQKMFTAQAGYKNGSIWDNHQDVIDASVRTSDRYILQRDQGKDEKSILADFKKLVKMKVFAWNAAHTMDTVMTPMDSIKYMKMFLQAGFLAMDPFTGEVKAWVGGIDHTFFQFDHVNENTKRQVGSTIKPLLYCLAVDNGFSPCGTVSTMPQTFPTMEAPYDAGGSEYESLPMRKALALSVNNAALYLLQQVGIGAFVDFAHKCGIASTLEKLPSVALGVSDISLFEMINAYSMFPTGGINTRPIFITKIEDKNGNLLKSFVPVQKEIISANTAFKMVKMMRGVIDFGTGRRMRGRYNIQGDIAGKTGTTNKQADAWFMGYTPQLLAGTWVGCDDRFLRFTNMELGQGSAAALPIWAYFIRRVFADKTLGIDQNARFVQPDGFDDCDVTDAGNDAKGNSGIIKGGNKNDDPIETVAPVFDDIKPKRK
ncbi:MAG: transglycosylase domain-containing protein [Bacteroidota bacterium]